MLKRKEIGRMEKTELTKNLVELKKELIKISSQTSSGVAPENPGKGKQIKKSIARINTKLNSLNKPGEVKNKGE